MTLSAPTGATSGLGSVLRHSHVRTAEREHQIKLRSPLIRRIQPSPLIPQTRLLGADAAAVTLTSRQQLDSRPPECAHRRAHRQPKAPSSDTSGGAQSSQGEQGAGSGSGSSDGTDWGAILNTVATAVGVIASLF